MLPPVWMGTGPTLVATGAVPTMNETSGTTSIATRAATASQYRTFAERSFLDSAPAGSGP
ncbi:MAG TPA: hypothetical protein VFY39_10285 [Gammaproteobacteria bacterium]|nr:hypothetical protein [Gammaproteobacteria bacterium]